MNRMLKRRVANAAKTIEAYCSGCSVCDCGSCSCYNYTCDNKGNLSYVSYDRVSSSQDAMGSSTLVSVTVLPATH